MFPRRTKRLAELESERAERVSAENVVRHIEESDSADDGRYDAADAFMSIFGMTRVKDIEK